MERPGQLRVMDGCGSRFGIIYVDFETQQRIPVAERRMIPGEACGNKAVSEAAVRDLAFARLLQSEQSTATASAAQTSRMRSSPSRPRRSTSTATDTLSTESRLTADRWGIGSSPGSSRTSLANPRIVVVHGATNVRRSLGIAASRDKTTTGRLPAPASSHHHTSPRAGSALTRQLQQAGTMRGRPTRPARRADASRRRHSWHRPRQRDDERAMT